MIMNFVVIPNKEI